MYVSKNPCADKSDDEENEVGNARRARDHDNAGRAEGDAATAGDARARLTPCPAGHRCRHASHACAQSRPHPSATKIVPYDAEDMRRPSWSNSGLFCLFIALSSDFPVWRQPRRARFPSPGRRAGRRAGKMLWVDKHRPNQLDKLDYHEVGGAASARDAPQRHVHVAPSPPYGCPRRTRDASAPVCRS